MAVHMVGAIAFLVLGASAVPSARTFVWRMLICLPLLWTAFVVGTSNRGALLTAVVGIVAVAILAPRSRNWLGLLAATAVFAIAVVFQGVLAGTGGSTAIHTAEPAPTPQSSTSSPSVEPAASRPAPPAASPSSRPTETTVDASSSVEPHAGDDAVENSGFELGPLSNGTIEGWTVGNLGSYNIVGEGGYHSTNFASVENVRDAYEATLTSSMIPFKGGEDIAVSTWVKAIAARPILEIYVNWYDRSGTLISSVFLNSLATEGVRTWQECVGHRETAGIGTHLNESAVGKRPNPFSTNHNDCELVIEPTDDGFRDRQAAERATERSQHVA